MIHVAAGFGVVMFNDSAILLPKLRQYAHQ